MARARRRRREWEKYHSEAAENHSLSRIHTRGAGGLQAADTRKHYTSDANDSGVLCRLGSGAARVEQRTCALLRRAVQQFFVQFVPRKLTHSLSCFRRTGTMFSSAAFQMSRDFIQKLHTGDAVVDDIVAAVRKDHCLFSRHCLTHVATCALCSCRLARQKALGRSSGSESLRATLRVSTYRLCAIVRDALPKTPIFVSIIVSLFVTERNSCCVFLHAPLGIAQFFHTNRSAGGGELRADRARRADGTRAHDRHHRGLFAVSFAALLVLAYAALRPILSSRTTTFGSWSSRF